MNTFLKLGFGFLVLSLILLYLFKGSLSPTPKDIQLKGFDNTCITSTGNCGSGDYNYVYTIKCDVYEKIKNSVEQVCSKNNEIYKNSLDMIELGECDSLKYLEADNNTPMLKKMSNRFCSWLNNKNQLNNNRPIFFTIDSDGKFREKN